MIKFKSYASGSSGNLNTVSDGHTTIMLDCGLSWNKVRQLLNFKTSDIAGILCGHLHLDHSKGLNKAIQSGLDIYASRETFNARNLSGHRCNEISDRKQFNIGTWKILPFKTIHDCEGALAFYMVNQNEEAFLYLTDSAYSPFKFKNLNVIACECSFNEEILSANILNGTIPKIVGHRMRRSHMSLDVFIKMLKSNDLSHCNSIFLLHLSSANANERDMIKRVQETTGIMCFTS